MSMTIEQQILNTAQMAYLIITPEFVVIGSGGNANVLTSLGIEQGQNLTEIVPELYGSEEILRAILAGQRANFALREVNRDNLEQGIAYFDLLTLPHSDEEGTIIGLIQVISDISDRGTLLQARMQQRNEYRLLQEQLSRQNIDLARINAELRRATQIKDEFLAGMSHEMRTPLTVILGMSELLRNQISGPLNQEQIENLIGIQESGKHLLALINDFLDIAKIEAGHLEIESSPVLVQSLCESVVRMVNDMAMRKRIQIKMDLDPHVYIINGDVRRLRQVLINLLSNAIKFTPTGGRIGLDLRGKSEEEAVDFHVWDTGIGIAADDAQQLFQPFVQIPGEHQEGQQGSGLGLALVAQLVELHGGGIKLESEVGQGSRFTITLPWDLAAEAEIMQHIKSPKDLQASRIDTTNTEAEAIGEGESILLVDDEPLGGKMLANYLQRCNYHVTLVKSADEALAYVRKEVPDLLITDIRMRGMDGLELIRHLRHNVATQKFPIMALTVLAMTGDREKCLQAGATAYLSKPLPLHRLASTIKHLLSTISVEG